MISIGKNLREYREKSGATQQQVADAIGVSKGALVIGKIIFVLLTWL